MEDNKNDLLSKIIDKLFSVKKETVILLLIFILAFVLRLIAAINLRVAADDMHHVIHAINFFKAGRLTTWDQSSGLWHAFTSIIYNIFGMTQLTSRAASLLFGSFSIFAIFLLTKEFFDEKTSLLASFLLAISPFHIKNTIAEMDVMTMFFVLMGILFFVRAIRLDRRYLYVLSGIFLGLSIYTKVYPLLFIPSLLVYFVYFKRKQKKEIFSNMKNIILFLIFIFIFCIPTLANNYLLYKDKGFSDYLFTTQLKIGKDKADQYYSWAADYGEGLNLKKGFLGADGDPPTIIYNVKDLMLASLNIFILALLGILVICIYRRASFDYLSFYIINIPLIFIFISCTINLTKHFLFFEMLIIPLAALGTMELIKKAKQIFKIKNIGVLIIVLIFFGSLLLLGSRISGIPYFYGESYVGQIIDFKNSNIPKDSLLIGDSREYRGTLNWAFFGRPYFEGTDFLNILNQQDKIQGKITQLDVYYFECVYDDCGWGTVKNQPEFNASMESLTDSFKKNGQLVKTISEPTMDPYYPFLIGAKSDAINIYHAKIDVKDSILSFASQPKEWFLYTIGYYPVEKNFDYYQTHNFLDYTLDRFAHFIVLVALLLSFFSPIYVIYLLNKK